MLRFLLLAGLTTVALPDLKKAKACQLSARADGVYLDSDNDGLSDGLESIGADADLDGEGVADLLQRNATDVIHTGLSGGGCAIGQGRMWFDPTLLLLLAAGGLGAGLRRRKTRSQ